MFSIASAGQDTILEVLYLICYDILLQTRQILLQNTRGILSQNAKNLLQNVTVITKCDNFITKCDSYYKTFCNVLQRLLQLATVHLFTYLFKVTY